MKRGRSDREVGGALRSLPVPEHADDFFDRLREQLVADYLDTSFAPALVTELSDVRRDPGQRTQPRLRRLLARATAPAAAVACFALVVGGAVVAREARDREQTGQSRREAAGQGRGPSGPQLSAVRPYAPAKSGVQVEFTMTRPGNRADYDATISPAGDFRIRRAEPHAEISHDAKADRRRTVVEEVGQTQYEEQTGISSGAPEPERSTPDLQLSRDLGAAVRAIAAEQPSRVTEVTYQGRPALQLDESIEPSLLKIDKITYIVDKETGYPLRIVQTFRGAFVREMAVHKLEPVQLTEGSFDLTEAPARPLAKVDHGHRDVTLAEAAELTDHPPLVPAWVPAGYRLDRVTLAMDQPVREGQTNPVSRQLLSLLYRRGYDSFIVTTRLARPYAFTKNDVWSNPLLQGTPLPDQTQPVRLRSGALSGKEARVGVYPLVWPHLWAGDDTRILTVAGDLTRAELLRVAESLTTFKAN